MIVLVLTSVPPGLRGHLTRWLTEVSAGVFVGKLPGRTRDRLWASTVNMLGDGRAIMVHSAQNEQGFDFRVYGHHWHPVDLDGLKLMLRPAPSQETEAAAQPEPRRAPGWSAAARRRRYRKR